MKLPHFVQKMKKSTLKDGLDAKKDAKRDVKSSFYCSDTQTLEDTGIFELPRTTIRPNPMLLHLYIVILQVFVEQLKAVLYKSQVMTPVIHLCKSDTPSI